MIGLNLFILHWLWNKFLEPILAALNDCFLGEQIEQYSCPLCGLWKLWSQISAQPGFESTTFGSVVRHSTTEPCFLHRWMVMRWGIYKIPQNMMARLRSEFTTFMARLQSELIKPGFVQWVSELLTLFLHKRELTDDKSMPDHPFWLVTSTVPSLQLADNFPTWISGLRFTRLFIVLN